MEQTSPEDVRTGKGDHTYYGPGSLFNWQSPLQEISLLVELPFWLMTPATTATVSLDSVSCLVAIDNDGVEFQRGNQYTRTPLGTAFIGGRSAAENTKFALPKLLDGVLFRGTRTLLYLPAKAHEDAIDALFGGDDPRFQQANLYFSSLCMGHIPILNELINAYRRVSVDPFASEVTSWDVPNWFISANSRTRAVCLCAHLVHDWYPTVCDGLNNAKSLPIFTAAPEDIEKHLSTPPIPGEIEMVDGWSLFRRGRCGDSIRTFVTAVEILLESEVRRLLAAAGSTFEEITTALDETRNNFEDRLVQYCKLSKRRVPGPMVNPIPELNGLRLMNEIVRTRKQRHRIVHHGHRIDERLSGPMLRAAETTSWFFDWLSDNSEFEYRRNRHSILFASLRGDGVRFKCVAQDGAIVVEKPEFPRPESADAGSDKGFPDTFIDLHHVVHDEAAFLKLISTSPAAGKDIELFVLMAMFELGLTAVLDSPFEDTSHPLPERFRTRIGDKTVGVFVLDCIERVSADDIKAICDYLKERSPDVGVLDHVILIANDQMDCDWSYRNGALLTETEQAANLNALTVVLVPDLARLVNGVLTLGWSTTLIIQDLLCVGQRLVSPPAGRSLGTVYHYWDRNKVVGVNSKDAVPDIPGEQLIAFRLRERFHQETAAEMRRDDQGRITFKTTLNRNELPVEAEVFVLDPVSSFRAKSEVPDNQEYPFVGGGSAWASKVIHPNRNL